MAALTIVCEGTREPICPIPCQAPFTKIWPERFLDQYRREQKVYLKTWKRFCDGDPEVSRRDLIEFESKYQKMEWTFADAVSALNASFPVPQCLILEVGVRVMLAKNISVEDGLVHGRRGRVIERATSSRDPLIQWDTDEKTTRIARATWEVPYADGILTVSQYPLTYAWAFTIHKVQGQTLDRALIDLSDAFCPGQGYTALSRVRELKGLHLLGDLDSSRLQTHPAVHVWYDSLPRAAE